MQELDEQELDEQDAAYDAGFNDGLTEQAQYKDGIIYRLKKALEHYASEDSWSVDDWDNGNKLLFHDDQHGYVRAQQALKETT